MGIKVSNLTITTTDGFKTATARWKRPDNPAYGQTDYYYVQWFYNTGSGWFNGDTENTDKNQGGNCSESKPYTIPSGANGVIVWVTPIAKTHKGANDQEETPYYIGEKVTYKVERGTSKPEKIENLTGEIKGNKIKTTAIIDNAAAKGITYVRFQYIKDTKQIAVMDIHVVNDVATASYSVDPGGNYQVRAKAVIYSGTTPIYSADWSDPVPGGKDKYFHSAPVAPTGFTLCAPDSKTSICIIWPGNTNNYNYEVQYTKDSKYFDVSDVVTSLIVSEGETKRIITDLTEGKEYFFRVRAVDKEQSDQHSAWSPVSSTKLGEKPGIPTTWSSTSTLSIGQDDPLILYWVHNTVDGSKMVKGYVTCIYDDEEYTGSVNGIGQSEEPEKTYFIKVYQEGQVPTGITEPYIAIPYSDGGTISWFVRTEGIIEGELSDPSITREVRTYSKPNILLSILGIESEDAKITSYPFRIKMESDVDGQMPITYSLSIVSNSMYETYDYTGKSTIITPGTVIFSKNYDYTTPELLVEMTPDMIDLVSGGEFVIFATVAFDSGLTAESQLAFTTEFVAEEYYVDAEISIDNNDAIAYIRPYAAYYKPITEGEPDDDEPDEEPKVYLAVFRRNADGTLIEIDSGLDNEDHTTIIDPHPTLDYARYRVIATDKATGIMTVYDTVPIKVGEKAIIIQWDEQWEAFNPERTDEMMVQPYSGSMVRLPYNVDVSESVDLQTEFVDYIGREHPVSYYGTHVGEKSNWSTVIPKYDTDTLYQLRRLSKWMGDVYVREPSGLGYWASIKLDFSQTHLDVTIPIKIDITRVEGGK